MARLSWASLSKIFMKDCSKIFVLKESDRIMKPLVALASDFISRRPTWSRQPAKMSMACPLAAALLAKPS